MTRFCYLLVLIVLSSPACAGESLSFVVGGHRIRIEAPRYCKSRSCVSLSIPGIYGTHRRRDRNDDVDSATDAASAKPPAPAREQVRPIVALASQPSVEPTVSAPPPAIVRAAAPATHEVAAPLQPSVQPPAAPPTKAVEVTLTIETPTDAARVPPEAAPQVLKISHDADDEPVDTPLGDWQTEGEKGSVRIEPCGGALCGYVLNPSSNAVGETVLINMKPKAASEWSGNIFSRNSGNTYYGTIALKGPNSLLVKACALGRFFCSGNVWSRIAGKPEKQITSRQTSSEPRS
jgi:uncharacterized protein (DUF2147 family)